MRPVLRGVLTALALALFLTVYGHAYTALVRSRGNHIPILFFLSSFLYGAALAFWLPFTFPQRSRVSSAHVLLFVSPFLLWYAAGQLRPHGSLANAVVEPLYLGLLVSLLELLRMLLPGRDVVAVRLRLALAIGAALLGALLFAFLFPSLPE